MDHRRSLRSRIDDKPQPNPTHSIVSNQALTAEHFKPSVTILRLRARQVLTGRAGHAFRTAAGRLGEALAKLFAIPGGLESHKKSSLAASDPDRNQSNHNQPDTRDTGTRTAGRIRQRTSGTAFWHRLRLQNIHNRRTENVDGRMFPSRLCWATS